MMSFRPGFKITYEMLKQGTKSGKICQQIQIRKQSCGGASGRCGIPPLKKKEFVTKEKVVLELDKNLQAPPCIPKGKPSTRFPPLCAIHEGIVCPRNITKYKYPAYSECRRRESKPRTVKECCYNPPPSCEINFVRDENTK